MPNITVSPGITNVLGTFIDQLDDAFVNGVPSDFTPETLVIATTDGVLTLNGTDLVADEFGGTGTITEIVFAFDNGENFTLSDLSFDVRALAQAYPEPGSGIDAVPLETFFLPLDWEVTTNNTDDVLLQGATSDNGTPLNFSGDNRFELNGGEDFFFAGDGDDTVFGGTGNDTLYGGNDNDLIKAGKQRDQIFGGDGKDNLFGGKGKDYVDGGAGNDRLRGDIGDDTLNGGASRDKMTGGDGDDVFLFNVEGNTRTGADAITDFEVYADALRFYEADQSNITFERSGSDVLVTHEGGTILVEGITDVAAVQESTVFFYDGA